jgi:hypothetical protein
MKALRCLIILFFVSTFNILPAQPIDSLKFFTDEPPLNATLTADLGKLMSDRMKKDDFKAIFETKLADSSVVKEEIMLNTRGVYRRQNCYLPPLRLNFHNSTSPRLYPLKTLKLVSGCRPTSFYEQLLLKEYLVYKIYNLLTPKSFLVRLVRATYEDSRGKKKPYTQYAFFIESIGALAKRNHCKEWKKNIMSYDGLDRDQVTMMSVFQYMIGNTDWGITNNHNLRFIYDKKDTASKPYVVPYDFDYSGLVNADYAVPNDDLGIQSVVQRLYRGFPRSMYELERVLEVFKQQKEKIYALINNFEPLDDRNKKEMVKYLDSFYETIKKKSDVEYIFIKNARRS